MIIRQAGEEDVRQIAEILVEDWQTAYRGIMDDDFLDSLSAEQRYQTEIRRYQKYTVAAEGDEVLGYAWNEMTGDDAADCEIIALYVRYSKRNRGIGRALMRHSMDCFRKAGKKSMIIWCLRENHESRKFYEKMGGKVYREGTHRWGSRDYGMISYLYQLNGYPDREEAEKLLLEAEKCNPGPWIRHSRTAAHCAENIAFYSGMNADKAYVLGLLHDIGRKFGVTYLKHVYDGYTYMMSLGYDDTARICLTHSFNENRIEAYVGRFDTTEEETELIRRKLWETEQDDYDKLIQLCDAIAGTEGVMDIIDRMTDVKNRYGSYDPDKWETNLKLKKYFEDRMGKDLYLAVDKDHYKPE